MENPVFWLIFIGLIAILGTVVSAMIREDRQTTRYLNSAFDFGGLALAVHFDQPNGSQTPLECLVAGSLAKHGARVFYERGMKRPQHLRGDIAPHNFLRGTLITLPSDGKHYRTHYRANVDLIGPDGNVVAAWVCDRERFNDGPGLDTLRLLSVDILQQLNAFFAATRRKEAPTTAETRPAPA